MSPRRIRRLVCTSVILLSLPLSDRSVQAVEPADLPPDFDGRKTAVAINYCRAAFHRIRKYPSKQVLVEEQEQILNNLNLNGIADEEVVKLYGAVLSEVNDVQIAASEREMIQTRFRQSLAQSLATNATAVALQAASFQYVGAIRTGASSWWDYRNMSRQRDADSFKVEKQRMTAVVDKSSLFLDTFWKLARKREIPDRWLVRSADLDRLEEAMREPDAEVRLRVLKRMEPFMECYPPYYYYVARTEQSLGQLSAAGQTYSQLAQVGTGHFRKDEMLAAGMANLALIQDHLHQAAAAETARQALRHSTDAWQVNLICAQVLSRHGGVTAAEDALLRNLDVELEREHSLANLVLLYARNDQNTKLAERLNTPESIRALPVPVLVECAAALGNEHAPAPLLAHLNASLYGFVDLRFGRDDVAVSALSCWDLQHATITLHMNRQRFVQAEVTTPRNGVQAVRFRGVAELGTPLRPMPPGSVAISIAWNDGRPVHLHLQPTVAGTPAAPAAIALVSDSDRAPAASARATGFRIAAIDVGPTRVSLVPGAAASSMVASMPAEPALIISSQPTFETSTIPVSLPIAQPSRGTTEAVAPLPPASGGTEAASNVPATNASLPRAVPIDVTPLP